MEEIIINIYANLFLIITARLNKFVHLMYGKDARGDKAPAEFGMVLILDYRMTS